MNFHDVDITFLLDMYRYCIGSNKDGPLVSGSLRSFVEQLGARASTPGGGSAAACIASMVRL